jgi:hypothetical protein
MLGKKRAKAARKNVLVHFHIFKNGGTTFDYALKREFGRKFAEFDGDRPRYVHLPNEIAAYLKNNPRVEALSSHHLRFPLPVESGLNLLPALFVRHPLDRMHSIYRYERKQKSDSPGSVHAKKLDFPDYVRWRLDQGRSNLLCNYHAMVLTCNPRDGILDIDAGLARTRLREATVCGVVDRLEESLALAESRLSPFFPKINLATTPQNVTAGRKASLQDRIDEAERACGPELFADVAARNELDLELYAMAGKLLQERIHGLADGAGCLETYRARCRRLA